MTSHYKPTRQKRNDLTEILLWIEINVTIHHKEYAQWMRAHLTKHLFCESYVTLNETLKPPMWFLFTYPEIGDTNFICAYWFI